MGGGRMVKKETENGKNSRVYKEYRAQQAQLVPLTLFVAVFLINSAVGAIFSSTDTVCTLQVLHQDETPLLYSLVFGEGVLLELSGILTVFFCGILMSHYAWHNVTESSQVTTRHIFAMMSYIAETFIFLYVGMDELDIEKWKSSKLRFQVKKKHFFQNFITIMLFGGGRCFHFSIHYRSWLPVVVSKIRISWSDTTRLSCLINSAVGAIFSSTDTVCTLQVLHQDETPLLYSLVFGEGVVNEATSVVLFNAIQKMDVTKLNSMTTLHVIGDFFYLFLTSTAAGVTVFGFLTKPLITYMIPRNSNTQNNRQEMKIPKDDVRLPLLSLEESATANLHRASESLSMLMESLVYTIHYYWRKFDNTFMRPVFGGSVSSRSEC
ncbi:hypothetical protein GH714_023481 [Hevea brasiliensis]|uniref:Cation/H+ exchanger transmembrane domain-containing protein n=1 Tax=Hevea brasiliensis TaxID=3981 RepID=A0A6A6LVZ2_HEVBR|nr:hypothetical protein GH714_023481 [Hevea brasiliensis]